VPLRGREHVTFHVAGEDGVRRLLGHRTLAVAALRCPLSLDQLRRQERRRADVADLSLVHEVRQRAERLVDVDLGARPVHLVEVDVVRGQPAQRALDLADDPATRVAALVRVVVVHGAVELGGEHDVVPAALERLADDLLGLAARVDVGGVDDVDPGVQGPVDDADALLMVRVAPGPEHHGSQGERADLDAGPSQVAVVHAASSWMRGMTGEAGRAGHRRTRIPVLHHGVVTGAPAASGPRPRATGS
jgi:hypothetical protein